MEPFVRNFVRSSLVWLGVGIVLGTAMAFRPETLFYRPAHMHANMLGFVSMMIFGVAYHVIPRFAGMPLRNLLLPRIHLWLANFGLAGLVLGWMLRAHGVEASLYLIPAGALASAIGAAIFIYSVWRILGQPPRQDAPPRRLPMLEG